MKNNLEDQIARFIIAEEDQFFERKSAWDRSGKRPKPRKLKDVAMDVAETICAMANADGGELVVGLEDDGTETGINLPEEKIQFLLRIPQDRNYLNPVAPCQVKTINSPEGHLLLHYDISWSPTVHLLADSRCLLRVRKQNLPFSSNDVAALKAAKSQGLFERSFPLSATMEDIDLTLLTYIGEKSWVGQEPLDVLNRYGLIQYRNGQAIPNLAALLLFGKNPGKWHPRCGIDFVRWEGKKREEGSKLNVAKRFAIETPLAVLISRAYDAIQPFIRERQNLADLFFTEKLEYPSFAWQEAIVNAVAHRDYSIQGAPIEVWMFDDHLEVRSPGLPPSPVTVEALTRREHIHLSRNPLIVRVLADLKYMRELGEGIPRMFSEMEREGFYPPQLEIIGGMSFRVTLRNEPIYDQKMIEWLTKFKDVQLSGDQKRMLVYAHAHNDSFTSRDYQKMIGTDIYGASSAIKDMIRKGVVRLTGKRSRVYTIHEPLLMLPDMPAGLETLLTLLQRKGYISNADVQTKVRVSRITATRMLKEWSASGWLILPQKRGLGAKYKPGPRLLHHSHIASETVETDAIGPETDAIKS